jgi:hypothetical protein
MARLPSRGMARRSVYALLHNCGVAEPRLFMKAVYNRACRRNASGSSSHQADELWTQCLHGHVVSLIDAKGCDRPVILLWVLD